MMEEEPKFKPGDRVYVGPLKMEATVIQQQKCWDYPDWFWGNVELQYDDGIKGVSNSWQLKKLTALDAMSGDGGYEERTLEEYEQAMVRIGRNYRKYCSQCETDVVICGKCGNNTCNGGYGVVDGVECDQCPSAYKEFQST